MPMAAATKRSLLILSCIFLAVSAQFVLAFDKEPHKSWDDICTLDAKPYQISEDFGSEPAYYDCALQYYYYVPCPTYSWFWAYSGWTPGEILGMSFTLGKEGTGGFDVCPTGTCSRVEGIRLLDFAGYGTVYPGYFTVEMDAYCGNSGGVPCFHLWNSGPLETHFGWNYFEVEPLIPIWKCPDFESGALSRFVLTMTMTGIDGVYPAVGFDNVSTPAEMGCEMHERSSMPAVYPRKPAGSAGTAVRSGYIGHYPFEHWPPLPIPDGKHAGDPAGSTWYGYAELAWRVYIRCDYPTENAR
jgi:hypothetical protein